jgi:hypothetical protein
VVPEDVKNDFLLRLRELPLLEEGRSPRWLKGIEERVVNYSLHIFCDASKAAYAAAVFVRGEYSTYVQEQFVQAKSRVSPLKQLNIPMLEPLAATIGAWLAVSVKKEIEQGKQSPFFWSESSTVIAWIQREDSWDVFVWNRIQEIRSLTTKEAWRHVPDAINSALPPSCGCSFRQLLDSLWWEGPPWFKLPPGDWPSGNHRQMKTC